MHADEAATDAALVRRLLARQFPHWAGLPVTPVRSDGTDNAMYRLGDGMAVRLPRRPEAAKQVEKEQRWLPQLAPHLPFAIPVPLAKGNPGEAYPWAWSVCRWLDGENPKPAHLADPHALAADLAAFILALQKIDPSGGPHPGRHNFGRGVPLSACDGYTRAAIEAAHGLIDTGAVIAAWEKDLAVAPWHGAPVWIHGDLGAGNLLLTGDRLSAVIDFGGLAIGDPATDLIVAWSLFDAAARQTFRAALRVDDATWARGRGWALSVALVALPYYLGTSPAIAEEARRIIGVVLADHADR